MIRVIIIFFIIITWEGVPGAVLGLGPYGCSPPLGVRAVPHKERKHLARTLPDAANDDDWLRMVSNGGQLVIKQ